MADSVDGQSGWSESGMKKPVQRRLLHGLRIGLVRPGSAIAHAAVRLSVPVEVRPRVFVARAWLIEKSPPRGRTCELVHNRVVGIELTFPKQEATALTLPIGILIVGSVYLALLYSPVILYLG